MHSIISDAGNVDAAPYCFYVYLHLTRIRLNSFLVNHCEAVGRCVCSLIKLATTYLFIYLFLLCYRQHTFGVNVEIYKESLKDICILKSDKYQIMLDIAWWFSAELAIFQNFHRFGERNTVRQHNTHSALRSSRLLNTSTSIIHSNYICFFTGRTLHEES